MSVLFFYLRVVEDKSSDTKDDTIQLWYRNVDPETNTTYHGNTGYYEQQIFNKMYNAMKSKNNG